MFPLVTTRLRIRNLQTNDWQDFFEYRSDPLICRFQGYDPYSQEKCREFVEHQSGAVFGEPGKWVQGGIELISENKLIGDIGLKPEADEPRIVTFGISLSSLYQGCGYAAEAMHIVIGKLFASQNVNRITGIADQENEGSIRLMERLGFQREGASRQSFWNNNRWRDEYQYALLRDDFHTAVP